MQIVVPVVFLVDVQQEGEECCERMEEFAREAVSDAVRGAARELAGVEEGDCQVVGAAVSIAPAAVFGEWYRPKKRRS